MSLVDAQYVSFTTYRRSGEAVATPVWIAPLPDGRAAFTTGPTSGKVKRLGHTPKVTVAPSDARGRVDPGVTPVEATAIVVVDGPDHRAAESALRRKYGLKFAAVRFGGKVRSLLGRSDVAVVVISF